MKQPVICRPAADDSFRNLLYGFCQLIQIEGDRRALDAGHGNGLPAPPRGVGQQVLLPVVEAVVVVDSLPVPVVVVLAVVLVVEAVVLVVEAVLPVPVLEVDFVVEAVVVVVDVDFVVEAVVEVDVVVSPGFLPALMTTDATLLPFS